MLELMLIRGLPGSGKSTLARDLANASTQNVAVFEADDFFLQINQPEESRHELSYRFDSRLLGAAHDYCYGRSIRALRDGYRVIVANTFSTQREIERYVRGVQRSGLKVRVQVVKCVGEFENVHNVPKTTVERMRARWEDYPGETVIDTSAVRVQA